MLDIHHGKAFQSKYSIAGKQDLKRMLCWSGKALFVVKGFYKSKNMPELLANCLKICAIFL